MATGNDSHHEADSGFPRHEYMNPSETAIREAVENLKRAPGTFQRLVERYAQLTFPDRFRELLPKG